MKKLLLFSFFLVSLTLAAITARASHVMAGNITYKHINGDSFLVTVAIYRDCNGIPLSNSPINVKYGTSSFSSTLPLISLKDVTPSCDGQSRCSGSYQYGIEEYIFQDTLVLPSSSSCIYTLSWEQSARNSSITTGAANANFYIETKLNRCLAPNNSSPEFIHLPVILINVGQDVSLNHTAIDPDNDFISYELVNPLSGSGAQIAYSGSWSSQKPITFLGFPNTNLSYPAGFRFDTLSSNMSFRPTKQNEVTVVTVKAKEWRKISGTFVQIGEVIRDVQLIIVTSATNKAPQVGNPDTAFVNICSPGAVCVEVPVLDPDINDTLTISYTHNLPNATIKKTVNSPNNKVVKVCFTPDSVMLTSGGSYFFTVYAQDNFCPLPGKTEKTYFMRIGPMFTSLPPIPDAYVCETDSPTVMLNVGPGIWTGNGVSNDSVGYKFSPANASTGWHQLKYNYTDSFSGCFYSDSMRVRVVVAPKAGFTVNDSIGLVSIDTFMFTNTTTADTLFQSFWNIGDSIGTSILLPNPSYTYNDTGFFTVTLWVSNGICPTDSLIKTHYIRVISDPATNGIFSATGAGLKIYPTPTANVVYIETSGDIRKIDLIDITGRTNSFTTPNGGNKAELNLEWFSEGVYVLQITDIAGKIYTGKVLIQH